MLRLVIVLSSVLMLAVGCGPAVVSKALPLPSAVAARTIDKLDPKLLSAVKGEWDGEPYRVGPGDTLLVAVYGHPELAMSHYTSTVMGGDPRRTGGLIVDNDGTIQFPLIGSVSVAGKSSNELRLFLEHELATYVKDPRVTVQVIFAGSIRYYMLGMFNQPGIKYGDRPMNLLEALALGGGVTLDRASLRGAYVARKGKRIPVNFKRLIRDGDMTQNIRLQSDDIVFIPDAQADQAFVFALSGREANRGGAVPFVNGRLDILQALATAGFAYRDRTMGRLAMTRVIRSDGDRGEVFTVNVRQIMNGRAAPFELAPGDIVIIPPTVVTRWNSLLEQLLPSLEVIGGVLTPYVQLKYLLE
jgi:polysaccharide biosynthesis/export protein